MAESSSDEDRLPLPADLHRDSQGQLMSILARLSHSRSTHGDMHA